MEQINALRLRNRLGEVLDALSERGEPILITKGRKVRAVLITPEQFRRRFVDRQCEEDKKRFLEGVRRLRRKRKGNLPSLDALRGLRGAST